MPVSRLGVLGPAAMALSLLACRPATPAPTAGATPAVRTARPARVEAPPPPVLAAIPPSAPPILSEAERDDPSGSSCEWACADLHDCMVLTGEHGPAAAASIELGCLAACVHGDEAPTLFGCARPESLEVGRCSPFLDCVAMSWPDPHTLELPAPERDPGGGCKRACAAFGRCFNTWTGPEALAECSSRCERVLDAEQQRAVGSCADLSRCEDIMQCVQDTPGA